MSNTEERIKKWIELIQAEKLGGVTEDIQANVVVKNEKINKHIFKLLLYLSHTADKCDRQNHETGEEIYKLTCMLCSMLADIPDSNKFVSSLFHIIRCLLAMCMFNEAFKVCFYLKTEALCCSDENVTDILVRVPYLWHNPVNNEFSALQKSPSSSKHYLQLKKLIEYKVETIQITHENPTKHVLTKISLYLDKIASINNKPNTFDFIEFIIEYLSKAKLFLDGNEKYIVYRHMLHIISRIMCENINEKCLKSATNILNTISNYFKKILAKDEECHRCFTLFGSLCLTLAKPIESLVENNVKRIKESTDDYIKLAQKYGYAGCIKWTTFSIVQILESLLIYWETCIKAGKKTYLKNDLLLGTMNLIGYISVCFIKQKSDNCKSCHSENCMVRKDIYNAVVIKSRCISLISKCSTDDLSKDICILVRKFLEKNIAYIYEMKESKCKCWTHLWSTSSALIYNLGIASSCFYEESISLFSLLLTSVIQFEGIHSKSRYVNLENPLCSALFRISTLHYNRGMYREAMTSTALHALLSYDDSESKAFRMWANIKHKSITCKEIMEMSILACLKRDKRKIEEMGFFMELSKYDLVEICLREARSLQEAKLDLSAAIHKVLGEMKALGATAVQYARAVQMLAYHSLHFDNCDKDVSKCLKKAVSSLKQIKMDGYVSCLQANLEFHVFVRQLQAVNKKTQAEMENTKFALYAPKINEIGESESCDEVPAYTLINIKEDSKLVIYLQVPLKKWSECFEQNIKEIAKGSESTITLQTLIIAGEYARLYRYQECEFNIWKCAYALATELQDNSTIIYVTGRCISLRHINNEWITTAKELAIKLKDSNDESATYAIAIFWISLSDFYFECDRLDEARKLLNASRKLPGISFFKNIAVHLFGLDRILCNCHLYEESIKHEEYTRYIVETLYTLVNLNEELSMKKWKPQDKLLFGFDILLSATVNLSLRMNSLLSFREICAHLLRRLRTAQTLGATIRVAEILKSLCYIDLSRSYLNDCEVKLQGLEHILNIETFKASMNSNLTKMNPESVLRTPIRDIDPIRDVPQNDASPVLRNRVFDLPEFMCHKDCSCYICRNVSYHYLVFASTHIRAQLYALQKNISASLQHFHGAFMIKEKLTKTKKYALERNNEYISWQERFYSIDYVLLLVNFSYFLRSYFNTTEDKIMSIVPLAIRMCDRYKLNGHPISVAVKELMLDWRFQKIFNSSDYSTFTVPDASDIETSKYAHESNMEESICVTPITINTRAKKPITLRRNRTPPLIKLTKVNMNFSDDEDNTSSPPTGYRKTRSHGRLTRRKILDAEYSDVVNPTKEETNQSDNSSSMEDLSDSKKENYSYDSIKDIINKIASLAPDISEHLSRIYIMDEPATSKNIKKLMDTIESLKGNATSARKSVRKTRHSKESTSSDSNKFNEVIALFKDFSINEINNESVSSAKTESLSCQKQNRISGETVEKLEQNNLDNLRKSCASENIKQRITRKSTRQETHNVKTRKCKEKL